MAASRSARASSARGRWGGRDIAKGLGTLLILLAPIAAAVGAIVATTGGITISIPIIVTVLTALVLALFGFSFVAGSRR
ncbi:hypothetical protein D8S78_05440 [Natrialba swarupiae]|nr:hypothetical protein [Natrialba swarupiae]